MYVGIYPIMGKKPFHRQQMLPRLIMFIVQISTVLPVEIYYRLNFLLYYNILPHDESKNNTFRARD